MSGKKVGGIDELCAELKENYSRAVFRDRGKNYRVIDIDKGAIGAGLDKLKGILRRQNVKIIYLVAEETNE